jgi:tRNA(Ile)-lysidine synthase
LATAKPFASNSLPQELWQCLTAAATARNRSPSDIHWVVAFSGGKDSAALAYAMSLLPESLPYVTLMHVHHGLQSEADEWLAHCQYFARDIGLGFFGQKVTVNTAARQSIEASARQARYDAMREYCRTHKGVLLLAQHEDDQLETVLLQLKRGAGPKGLSGMAKELEIDGVLQLRPWLSCSQQRIVDFTTEHKISCVQDPSNYDTSYDRNFLRNDVLPLLTKRWTGLTKAVARSAALCAQQNKLIEDQAQAWLKQHEKSVKVLPEHALLKLSKAWQAETLRFWCSQYGVKSPAHDQLHAFLDALQSSPDKQPQLNFHSAVLRRFSGHLYLQQGEVSPLYGGFEQAISLDSMQYLPVSKQWGVHIEWMEKATELSEQHGSTCMFELPRTQLVTVQQVNSHSRIAISENKCISGKRLFKQARIAPWLRQHTLGLFCGHILIALINELGICPIAKAFALDSVAKRQPSETNNPAYLFVSLRTAPYQHD